MCQHQGGGPRNALGHRPEPEVLPLPAETSREAPKCCAWQHQGGGGPETRSGTVQSLKCCPCQQKRGARLPSAAPGSIRGGAPKRARAPSRASSAAPAETSREAPKCCAWQHQGGGPRNALGHRPEPQVLPLPAETSREAPKCCAWQHQGGGPRNALGHRPEPEVLPLPAETRREAPKCCAWQHQGGGPRNALGHRPEPVLPLPKCCAWQHQGGGAPKRARAPSRA